MSIRLRQICLVAEKLAPAIADFKAVLGLEVCFKDPEVAVFGLENSLMPVGSNFIEVVAPVKENTAARRYLKRRNGDGGDRRTSHAHAHARVGKGDEGRREGLRGIDGVVADRKRRLNAAGSRGLRGSGDHVTIGGTRFSLV